MPVLPKKTLKLNMILLFKKNSIVPHRYFSTAALRSLNAVFYVFVSFFESLSSLFVTYRWYSIKKIQKNYLRRFFLFSACMCATSNQKQKKSNMDADNVFLYIQKIQLITKNHPFFFCIISTDFFSFSSFLQF